VANIGQECYVCKTNNSSAKNANTPVWVKPFRIEVVKGKPSNNYGGILGGGPRKTKHFPKVPIAEDEEVDTEYTEHDQARHVSGASNTLVGEGMNSFDLVAQQKEGDSGEKEHRSIMPPSGYTHHCQGCSTGVCKSRFLPKSKPHEISDNDTISTSASVMTNSSVGKDEYQDRDLDFADYSDEDDEGGEIISSSSWQHV
jgi:hypothetical protein